MTRRSRVGEAVGAGDTGKAGWDPPRTSDDEVCRAGPRPDTLDGGTRRGQHGQVASWGESAKREAQDDLDGLLDVALPLAQRLLGERGEVVPFGVVRAADGQARMVAADIGQDDTPRRDAVLAALVEGVRGERELLRAVALVSDVRAGDNDALRVDLEHREGTAMAVLLPYRLKRLRRGVEYGGLAACPARPTIWP